VNTNEIVAALDIEIARLQQARAALAGFDAPRRRGRPPASPAAASSRALEKRTMSAAGRARIAEAQRKRWAAQKRAATKR
jgi:hypothetical protein